MIKMCLVSDAVRENESTDTVELVAYKHINSCNKISIHHIQGAKEPIKAMTMDNILYITYCNED